MVNRLAGDSLTRRLQGPFVVSWPAELVNKDGIAMLKYPTPRSYSIFQLISLVLLPCFKIEVLFF